MLLVNLLPKSQYL